MKKVVGIIIALAVIGALFGNTEDTGAKNENATKTNAATTEQKQETEKAVPVSQKEDIHEEVTWGEDSCGPLSYDAPISWRSESDTNSKIYSPIYANGIVYFITVVYDEGDTTNIGINNIRGKHEDADVYETEVAGCKAYRVEYYDDVNGNSFYLISYYIKVYPDHGMARITYGGQTSAPSVYENEFETLLGSIYVEEDDQYVKTYPYVYEDEEEEEYEYDTASNYYVSQPGGYYILNESTGKFHEPTCYKVPEIINSVEMYDSYAEMIANGYEPCGICDPR